MTDILKALEEAEKAATPGPWGLRSSDGTIAPSGWYVVEEAGVDLSLCAIAPAENAELIALLRNSFPHLVEALKAADALARAIDTYGAGAIGEVIDDPEFSDLWQTYRAARAKLGAK